MAFDPRQPYNDLPLLPPKTDIESRAILKSCIKGRASLAALQQATGLIPNPAVLINTIPLLEAQASSEIENIVTTTDALFRYAQLDEQAANAATKEALRYRTALHRGFKSLKERPVSTATAERVCSIIKDRNMQVRRVPGTALANDKTGEIIYTPPVGEALIRNKLANWERFIHEREEIDPLIRMAVAHYQFEAIHPFTDGNGRTGRILNLLMLVEQQMIDLPVLYLSRYIIRNKADYYRMLQEVTQKKAWEHWIVYILNAVHETAAWTTAKIHAIRRLMDHTGDFTRSRALKVYSRELVEATFVQPYCRIQNVVDAGIAQRQTASVYLKELCDIGVLREIKAGREKLFIHPKFIKLLTSDGHNFRNYD
jgi:Fic family protein